jgi:hypothetical protein
MSSMAALMWGMLILMVPSFLVCAGMAWMMYHRRHDTFDD